MSLAFRWQAFHRRSRWHSFALTMPCRPVKKRLWSKCSRISSRNHRKITKSIPSLKTGKGDRLRSTFPNTSGTSIGLVFQFTHFSFRMVLDWLQNSNRISIHKNRKFLLAYSLPRKQKSLVETENEKRPLLIKLLADRGTFVRNSCTTCLRFLPTNLVLSVSMVRFKCLFISFENFANRTDNLMKAYRFGIFDDDFGNSTVGRKRCTER